MKKLLTLTLALLASGAVHAVTMNWAANSVSFGDTKLKSDNGVVGYLIATSSLGTYALDGFSVSDIGTQVNTKAGTTTMSKLSGTWTIDTDNYSNGDTFAVLLSYEKDGKTYYNLSSSLVTMSGMVLDPPTDAANVTASFSWTDYGEQTTLTAGSGWTTLKPTEPGPGPQPEVPEPATGALALAGVALLFKRRRA